MSTTQKLVIYRFLSRLVLILFFMVFGYGVYYLGKGKKQVYRNGVCEYHHYNETYEERFCKLVGQFIKKHNCPCEYFIKYNPFKNEMMPNRMR